MKSTLFDVWNNALNIYLCSNIVDLRQKEVFTNQIWYFHFLPVDIQSNALCYFYHVGVISIFGRNCLHEASITHPALLYIAVFWHLFVNWMSMLPYGSNLEYHIWYSKYFHLVWNPTIYIAAQILYAQHDMSFTSCVFL